MIPHQKTVCNPTMGSFYWHQTHSGVKQHPGVRLPSVPSCLDSVQAAEVAHICGVEIWLVPSQWMGGQSYREERSLLNIIKLLTGKKVLFWTFAKIVLHHFSKSGWCRGSEEIFYTNVRGSEEIFGWVKDSLCWMSWKNHICWASWIGRHKEG